MPPAGTDDAAEGTVTENVSPPYVVLYILVSLLSLMFVLYCRHSRPVKLAFNNNSGSPTALNAATIAYYICLWVVLPQLVLLMIFWLLIITDE